MRIFLMIVVIVEMLATNLCSAIELEDIEAGHVWLFEDGDATDSVNNLAGAIIGGPGEAQGLYGTALSFDGSADGITLQDSAHINSGGPWTNRTIIATFSCPDVDKQDKQVIYEEGGRTRGLVLYVFDGEVWIGGWNRSEYNWQGEWISASVRSDQWYTVALVLRDTQGKVEDDKFEMWLNGELVEKRPGGQLHAHTDDNGIGHTNQNVVFHDEDGSGDNRDFFEGLIDEIWLDNTAWSEEDLRATRISVEPISKLASSWGAIKSQR